MEILGRLGWTSDLLSLLEWLWRGLGDLIANGFGAFLGAYLAFRLETSRQRGAEASRQAASIHRAIFILQTQHSELMLLKDELDGLRLAQNRETRIQRFFGNPRPLVLQFDDLLHLLESSDPALLRELFFADSEYNGFRQLADSRNRLLDEYDEERRKPGSRFSGQLGVTHGRLKSATDTLYGLIDHAVPLNLRCTSALKGLLSKRFPGAARIDWEDLRHPPITTQS